MQAAFSGSVPIRFQWQFWDTNGVGPVNIPGATNFVYTIPSVTHAQAGTYSCMASNNAGGVPSVSNSTPAVLTVPIPPTYFVSDYSYSTFNGTHYSGVGVIGAGTYWNTVDTTGANQTGYSDDSVTDLFLGFTSTRTWDFAHGGGIDLLDYYILNQGSGQTTFGLHNLPNGVYNLAVYACNGHYQYSQTAITIGGVTQNALASTDTEFLQNNNYVIFTNVVVTNGSINAIWQKAGTVESAINGVQVELGYALEDPAVNITTQPANAVVASDQPAIFSVVAYGPPPLRYQWRADGLAIAHATNSTLKFSPPTAADTLPAYDVVVTSPSSGLAATSSVVSLTIRSTVDNLLWRGYGLKWDLSSANWQNTGTAADAVPYQQGDNVLFDDTTAGNTTLYLLGQTMPSSVTVNSSSSNYTFRGVGYLSWTMGLKVTGAGQLTLATVNDYTGNTTLNPGARLALSGSGSIGSSANIILGNGATLSATARSDGALTVNPTQTLKGSGAYNITGSVVNNGTLEFNVTKTSGVTTNDRLQGMTAITYGGTLKLDLHGEPLAGGDAVKLFNATTYSSAFAAIVPPLPGTGLLWNTSTFAADGTLRVVSAVKPTPTNMVNVISGNSLSLSWPADHIGWRLQSQTNTLTVGLGTNWVDVTGANLTNQVTVPINPANGSVFFRMVYP
jgi:autotransporter-associated beta strand protein